MGHGVTQAKSGGNFTLRKNIIVLRRGLYMMTGTVTYNFNTGGQAAMIRAFTNGGAIILVGCSLMLTRGVTCFSTTCTSVTYKGVNIYTSISMGLHRGTLTRTRGFVITFTFKVGI